MRREMGHSKPKLPTLKEAAETSSRRRKSELWWMSVRRVLLWDWT